MLVFAYFLASFDRVLSMIHIELIEIMSYPYFRVISGKLSMSTLEPNIQSQYGIVLLFGANIQSQRNYLVLLFIFVSFLISTVILLLCYLSFCYFKVSAQYAHYLSFRDRG